MPSPSVSLRPTPIANGTAPTPAAAYALEQRILRAYRRLLHQQTEEEYQQLVSELVQGVMKPRKTLSRADSRKLADAREERIYDDVPELIQLLRWDEQQPLADLLLCDTPDLAGAVTLVLSKERPLLQREAPPATPDDAGHARAAGLGRLSSQNYGKLHPGYQLRLFAQQQEARAVAPLPKPALRPKARRRPARPWLKLQQLSLGL